MPPYFPFRRAPEPPDLPALRLALALVLGAPAAWASGPSLLDLEIEEILQAKVTTASKFAQPQAHAPAAVAVITAEDIRAHGWRTLGEALLSLPGTYAINDHTYAFVGARGFLIPGDYNTRLLLLVDGMRVNDNIYEQAFFGDEFLLDMELVERIEYAPGPGSSIYGANAMFGVINVVTRPAASLAGPRFALRAGGDGERHGRFSWGGGDADRNLLVSASRADRYGRDRFYPDAASLGLSADGIARDADQATLDRLFLRANFSGWTLEGIWRDRSIHPSSALYGSLFGDPRLRLDDSGYIAALSKEGGIAAGVSLFGRVQLAEMRYDAVYPLDDGAGGSYLNADEVVGRWWNGELRLDISRIENHRFITGLEWQQDIEARQRNFDLSPQPASVSIDTERRRRRWGLYVQDEWRLADSFLLNLGVRYDWFSFSRQATTPRLAALWFPSPGTTIKLLSGRAFRPANAYESDYADGVNYLANPALRPETIRTHELVWEQRAGQRTLLSASLFSYRMEGLIAQTVDLSGALIFQNLAPISADGVELAGDHHFAGGTRLRGSLAAQRVTNADGSHFANSPYAIAKFQLQTPLGSPRWTLGWETQIVGPRQWGWQGSEQSVDSQVIAHASVSGKNIVPGLDLSISLRNVFDERLVDPAAEETGVPGVPQNGRTLVLKLDYAF